MLGPNPFGKAHAWGNKVITTRFDVGLQEVVKVVYAHITPRDEEDVFVQIVKDFRVLVGNVAPHHYTLAIRAKHPIDAVNVLVINLFRSNGIHIRFGIALAKALSFVAVDVEIR